MRTQASDSKSIFVIETQIRWLTNPGGMFAGSGTTAVAIFKSRQRFTGSELNPEHDQLRSANPYQDKLITPDIVQLGLCSSQSKFET